MQVPRRRDGLRTQKGKGQNRLEEVVGSYYRKTLDRGSYPAQLPC